MADQNWPWVEDFDDTKVMDDLYNDYFIVKVMIEMWQCIKKFFSKFLLPIQASLHKYDTNRDEGLQ